MRGQSKRVRGGGAQRPPLPTPPPAAAAAAASATASPLLRASLQLGSKAQAAAGPALSPEEWRSFKLVHKEALTSGVPAPTVLYRFALGSAEQEAGLPVASCLVVRAPIGSDKPDGSKAFVIRPYTPISQPDQRGSFDLAIKIYRDGGCDGGGRGAVLVWVRASVCAGRRV